MSIYEMSLDLKKSLPIYSDPIVLRQGDTNAEILVHVLDNSTPKNLENLHIEFHADKPDATTIDDDEQSHFTIGADKESFTYTVPDELTDASGSTTNTYFKIGSDSTSNFYIHILTKAGMEKLESGDYISKVDRIFNHVMSDYAAINELAETGKGTFDTALAASTKEIKDLMDNLNAEYVQFINSKTTDFNTFLANLDSQASDVEAKYTTLKAQLDALVVPVNAVGTNLLQGTRDFSGNEYPSLNKVSVTNGQGQFQAVTGTNHSDAAYDLISFWNLPLEKDTDYTASFWVKTSENVDISSYLFDSGSNGNYSDGKTINQSTTDYTRVVAHFHNGNDNATPNFIPVRINKKDVTVWFYGLKLEKGSVATDWCPNPAEISTSGEVTKQIKASQPDLSGFQTQAIFKTGDFVLNTCPQGTDFGEFLKSDSVPIGFSIIRNNNNVSCNDWQILKENNQYVYGLGTDYNGCMWHLEVKNGTYMGIKTVMSNLTGKTITATDDTGKTVKLNITDIS